MEQDGLTNDRVREGIEDIMQRSGLTETEARARYHLREALDALLEVTKTPVRPDVEPIGPFYSMATIVPHMDALNNFLARRVLERERPEGWGRPTRDESDDEED